MNPIQKKLRITEWSLALLFTVLYNVVHLSRVIKYFDNEIGKVQNYEYILMDYTSFWDAVREYDTIKYINLPTIIAAILFFGAWTLLHFFTVPKIVKKEFNTTVILMLASVLLLTFLSVWSYHFFKLNWRIEKEELDHVSGFATESIYRKWFVFNSFLNACFVLLAYELGMLLVYHLEKKAIEKTDQANVGAYVCVAAIWVLTGIFWVSVGSIGNVVIHPPQPAYWASIAFGAILFHGLAYYGLFPFVLIPQSIKTAKGVLVFIFGGLAYVVFCVVSYAVIYKHIPRDIFDLEAVFTLAAGIGYISAVIRSYIDYTRTTLTNQIVHKSTELASLKAQVNPHFLFNALNTLYAVALREKAEDTSTGIQKLGDMMRFMLHDNNQDKISLVKEIEYLENYISLQRLRLDQNFSIDIKVIIQPQEKEIWIAPMLINPLVENAFKHGVSLRNPSWIYITITFDDTYLYCKVHNSMHVRQGLDTEKASGIGLDNLKKRLQMIYPNRHRLDIQSNSHEYFVSLQINYLPFQTQ